MTTLEELAVKRGAYVEAARSNGFEEGLRKLLADLYPDNAHFIYELLQNAEDARAGEIWFELRDDGLMVEHNGTRAFDLKDIESITGIGQSTKADEVTSIGKFGVGFKAVFAYTQTPQIQSGAYSFAIKDLFIPTPIEPFAQQPGHTTFWFPFDRPEKDPSRAKAEVSKALTEISRSTLLFLDNIRIIGSTFPDGSDRLLERRDVDEHIIEIDSVNEGVGPTHWYRIKGTAPVDGTEFPVAAAFSLTRATTMADGNATDPVLPLSSGSFVVEPVNGQVSIYFPAIKETSGLKFHIHAPFASTVARDSVREGAGNDQLIDGIGALVAATLLTMRDTGLMTDGLLTALPNGDDEVPDRYHSLRSQIVKAFERSPITPVLGGGYAESERLIRSVGPIRAALDTSDVDRLLDISAANNTEPMMGWLADRDGRPGKFLDSLRAVSFGATELADMFEQVTDIRRQVEYWGDDADEYVDEDDRRRLESWREWIFSKEDAWLRNFYVSLGRLVANDRNPYKSFDMRHYQYIEFSSRLGGVPMIRVQGAEGISHITPDKAYLPTTPGLQTAGLVLDSLVAFVDDDEEGAHKSSRAALTSFYSAAGVKEWNASLQLNVRLGAYSNVAPEVSTSHLEDLANLKQLIDEGAISASEYASRRILVTRRLDGSLKWSAPSNTFIDTPFKDTGLSSLYASGFTRKDPPAQLTDSYFGAQIDVAALAQQLGAITTVAIVTTNVLHNAQFRPIWRHVARENNNGMRRDWIISDFADIVETHDEVLLRSLWNVVANADLDKAEASYRANGSSDLHRIDSQLLQALTTIPWVLDRDGNLRLPTDATTGDLDSQLIMPSNSPLVQRASFGRTAVLIEERERGDETSAKDLGFASVQEARDAAKLISENPDGFKEWVRQQRGSTLPEASSPSPERRAHRAREQAVEAPIREYAERVRRVRVQEPGLRSAARSYLSELYTNNDGVMVCQACYAAMPFKVDGQYYFEAVQFVSDATHDLTANRLALCPTCAAKYQHARSTSLEDLRDDLLTQTVGELGSVTVEATLAGVGHRLRFVGKHAIDLQVALESREAPPAAAPPE